MNDAPGTSVPAGPFPEVVPELSEGRVGLRAMTEADLPAVVEQSTDPDTVRWTTVPSPYDLETARDFLGLHATGWAEPQGRKHWAIELLPGTGRPEAPFAGIVDLRPGEAPGTAWEIGFALHPRARGCGAMSAAVRLAAAWAFEHGAPSLYWYAARGNFASRRVAWASGFTQLGTLPALVADRVEGTSDAWAAVLRPGDPMRPRGDWLVPPVVEGDVVRLRPLRDDDRAMAEPHDHPPHHAPARSIPAPETFAPWLLRRRELMAEGRGHNWCIAETATDEPLGEVLVFDRDGELGAGGTAELGYFIRPSARGHGFAERAARAASGHALRLTSEGGLGLRRLVAQTASDNVASQLVLSRCGFTRWGREDHAVEPDGSIRAQDHWERLARG